MTELNQANLQKNNNKKPLPPSKKERDDEYARDHQMVRGIFRFHEVPGGVMSFVYKKHKGDEVLFYTLHDGQVYSLPLMVAKHLNKNCWYPVHDYETDEQGKFTNGYRIHKKVRRCSFQSLEFVDEEDINPIGEATIYTAQSIGN